MESVQDDCIIPPGSLHTSNFVIIVEVSFFTKSGLFKGIYYKVSLFHGK